MATIFNKIEKWLKSAYYALKIKIKSRKPLRLYDDNWSERHDLNVRPLPPQGSALAKLSYAPKRQ
jgi:hypothetical protein